jgi:hypothetical protein
MAIGRCTAQDNQRLCEGCRDWNLLLDILKIGAAGVWGDDMCEAGY